MGAENWARDSSVLPCRKMSIRPATPKTRVSLRLKLTLGLILIIGALFAAINTLNLVTSQRAHRKQALLNTETIARLVAGTLVAELANSNFDSPSYKTFVENVLSATFTAQNPDLAFATVLTENHAVLAGRANTALTPFPRGKRYQSEKVVLDEVAKRRGKFGGFIKTKRFPLQLRGKIIGTVIVGTSLERVEREARRALLINLGVLAGTLLLLFLYSAFTLGHWIFGPLNKVVNAMRAVHDGNLNVSVDVKSNDEIGVLSDTFDFMVTGLKEREALQDAFSRYVSDKVYQKFREGAITFSGENRIGTVLFSDIRSFTQLSEQLTPQQVVTMLNEYFNEMVEIVFKYDGFLNKFIGDALMAIYNVPIDQPHPELRAVKTAIEMVQRLRKLNARRQQRGQFPIKIGIGINTGPLVAGNIGHEKRLEYTVIGDAVNLAQRIESQTKVAGYEVLISESTYRRVEAYVDVDALPPVKVKGKSEPVTLYGVKGLAATPPP